MHKITPFLWFDDDAEEAMDFYCSVFKSAKVVDVTRNDAGQLFTATFDLEGQRFMVLNAGPHFKFNESISFFVSCKDQQEVDYFWQKLTADGGEESQCGWLKDRFGLSWQIIPTRLGELLGDDDPEKAGRAMEAMLKMRKIDVKKLEAAHAGR